MLSVTLSADGSRLISSSQDSIVLLWDISDNAQPYVLCEKFAADVFYLSTLDCVFLLEARTNPSLCGLATLNMSDGSPFDTRVIFWFPPDLSPRRLAVHPAASMAAVVCDHGNHLLLDISKACTL